MQRTRSISTATQNQKQHKGTNDLSVNLDTTMNLNGVVVSKSPPSKTLAHVPCKFFKQGTCQAGSSCPFSHDIDATMDDTPCKYFQNGNCKFGIKCALAHILPDGTRLNPKSLAQVYQNHNIIQKVNNGNIRGSNGLPINHHNCFSSSSSKGINHSLSVSLQDSNITSNYFMNITNTQNLKSPIDIQDHSRVNLSSQFEALNTPVSTRFQENYEMANYYPQSQITPIRHSSFSYDIHTGGISSQYTNSGSYNNTTSNIWSNSPNTAQTSPSIIRAQIMHSSNSIPTFHANTGSGSLKSGFNMDVFSGSAICDEDDDAYGRNGVYEEDYVPSSLTDLLTPQELQRRGSRPSTNSKRPSFDVNSGVVRADIPLETQFDME